MALVAVAAAAAQVVVKTERRWVSAFGVALGAVVAAVAAVAQAVKEVVQVLPAVRPLPFSFARAVWY